MNISLQQYIILKSKFNPLLSRIQNELNDLLKEKGYETVQFIDYRLEIIKPLFKQETELPEICFYFVFSYDENIDDLLRDRIYELVWEYIDNNKIEDKIRGISIRGNMLKLILKRDIIDDILESIKDIK